MLFLCSGLGEGKGAGGVPYHTAHRARQVKQVNEAGEVGLGELKGPAPTQRTAAAWLRQAAVLGECRLGFARPSNSFQKKWKISIFM